jgi:hypothetical protein
MEVNKMEEPIYVIVKPALDLSDIKNDGPFADSLVRAVSKEYMKKSFGEMIQQAANPHADGYSDGPMADSKVLNQVEIYLASANRDPTTVIVTALSNNNEIGDFQIPSLLSTVGDYADNIVRKIRNPTEMMDTKKYESITLILEDHAPGGRTLEYLVK